MDSNMILYPWQVRGKDHILSKVSQFPALLDASDTGTGKTITALAVFKELGMTPLVICPKSILTAWRRAAQAMNVTLVDVLNVEKLKTGKTPYLKKGTGRSQWIWTLPRGSWVIWDEVQNASGYKSQNGKILAMTRVFGIKVLMLSATAAESPLKLKAIGYLLGLHGYKDHFSWCLKNGCWQNSWGGLEFSKARSRTLALEGIHRAIFPEKGVRARIADIPEFPENQIIAEAYDLAEHKEEVQQIYNILRDELKKPENAGNPLTVLLRARQQVERLKVPIITELTEDVLDEGKSMVIFVAFRETFDVLTKFWNCSRIYGGQSEQERVKEIDAFQANLRRVCVCMVQAGGVGISLQDLTGNAPLESLLTPGYNAVEIRQALGRIHRANGKSKTIQKILFAANTCEEEACEAVRRKLANIDAINDGDLSAGIF